MKQILINSAIGYTGYGVVGWNLIKELHSQNIDVTVFPIHMQRFGQMPRLESDEDNQLLTNLANKDFNPNATCVKIWHQFDLAERIGVGKYIAFPFFELDTFNQKEVLHLGVPNEIVVSSNWAKQILRNHNISQPINIVPLGVDASVFDHNLCNNYIKNEDSPYIFLSIGKWEIRKGHDILLNLFNKAFDINDNVELWIAASSDKTCFSNKELSDWHGYYSSGPLKDKIKIIPRLPTQKDIATKIAQADCGIFMSRAEGWNLELLEMMSMNKPVIATNYSAHTEFCNSNNSYLVDIDSLEVAYDGKWFHGVGKWANIGQNQQDQAIEYMRYLYKTKIRDNPNGIETGQKYSWKNSVASLLKCI